jgi:hypothetical protein
MAVGTGRGRMASHHAVLPVDGIFLDRKRKRKSRGLIKQAVGKLTKETLRHARILGTKDLNRKRKRVTHGENQDL